MRRAALLIVVVVVFGTGAVLAAGDGAPIATETLADVTGDAGGGPDISSMTLTVGADQAVTFSATLSNRSSLRPDESLQFFVNTGTSSGYLNISAFQSQATELDAWTGTAWRGQHEVPSTWSNGTFTTTIPLGDLQDALQAPVRPAIFVSVVSYVGATPGATPTAVDSAPDTGSFGLNTVDTRGTTTVVTTTTTTAPSPSGPSGARPRIDEKIVRLARSRIEWKRLAVVGVAANARVSIACTKGCKLTERPKVVRGRAASRKFVGVAFRRGVSYRVDVVEPSGAGWWWQKTVAAKAASTVAGCIESDGRRVPLSGC